MEKSLKMKTRKYPMVSVVTITYNGLSLLKDCLKSVYAMDYPRDRFEVVVVDNDSSDGTVEFVRRKYPTAKIVQNKANLGYVGMNNAMPVCKGKYIYVINNDIMVNRECLKRLVETLENDDKIGMSIHTLINHYNRKLVSGGTWISRSMYSGHYPKEDDTIVKEIPYMGGGLIRREVISKFGYIFDPDYFLYGEDVELGLRIKLMGMKCVVDSRAINYHKHAMTAKKYVGSQKSTYLMERNSIITFLKIFSAKTLILLFPYFIGVRLMVMLKDVVSLRFSLFWARICAWSWVVANVPLILRKRKALQRLRKTDDKHILQMFTEKYLLKKPFLV